MADTPEKATAVAELTEQFRSSSATVLTEYRGLTVAQLTAAAPLARQRRRRTRSSKNTLTKRAATEAGIAGLDELFTGPTALAFVTGDPVEAAKGLRDFAQDQPAAGDQGRRASRARPLSRGRGRQARRPRVPRGAAGQAGRRHEGATLSQGRRPVPGPAVAGRPPRRAALQDEAQQDATALQQPPDAAPPTDATPDRTQANRRREKDARHGEAQHRRAARRVQGDDADRAVRVREAVRGDLRRHRGRAGRRRRRRPGRRRRRGRGRSEEQDEFDVVLEADGEQEDPGHQGRARADRPGPQGGQGPGRRRARRRSSRRSTRRPPRRPRPSSRATAPRSPSSSPAAPTRCLRPLRGRGQRPLRRRSAPS